MAAVQIQRLSPEPDRRALIAGAAAIPLVLGSVLPQSVVEDGVSVCIFHEATGLPCPFCGATRAFVAFGHGQGEWMNFNGYWVLLALATIATALILAVADRRAGGVSTRLRENFSVPLLFRKSWVIAASVVLPGWIWALANASRIH